MVTWYLIGIISASTWRTNNVMDPTIAANLDLCLTPTISLNLVES